MDFIHKAISESELGQFRYHDRRQAGRKLGELLGRHRGEDAIVLGLPRGGVPVAYEVAKAIEAPLDVFTVRKLGVPGHEELAMGAIASGGVRTINHEVVSMLGIPEQVIDAVSKNEAEELERRERQYRGDRPAPRLEGRTVILVDDGLATGSSMRAAVSAVRQKHPAEIVVAVPVSAETTCEELRQEVDEVVCALTPEPFHAVGLWYEDFSQTSDEEVEELLRQAGR